MHCFAALQDTHIDLVVSGINRGDNAGLHVIYSGTVGAAREGACKVRRRAAPRLGGTSGAGRESHQPGGTGPRRSRRYHLTLTDL